MSYKRHLLPLKFATGDDLSKDMAGIGFIITAEPSPNPNIEDTLIATSIEGVKGDFRTLSLLVNWLEVHGRSVINADRLTRMVSLLEDEKLLCFWSATAKNILTDSRFKKLKKIYKGKRRDLLKVGSEFQLGRFGEDPRFEKSCLRVPANVLRNRPRDILPPARLAKLHPGYRYRVVIGPTYRADQWAVLEQTEKITPSELAKLSYSSFGSAWQARRDFELLKTV